MDAAARVEVYRWLVIVTAVLIVIAVAGCGGGSSTPNRAIPNPGEVTSNPRPTTSPQFFYVANTGSGNISGFAVNPSGALSALAGSPFAIASPVTLVPLTGDRLLAVQASSVASTTNSGLAVFSIDRATGLLTAVSSGTTGATVGGTTTAPSPAAGQFQANQFAARDSTGTFVYISGTALSTSTVGGINTSTGTPAIGAFSASSGTVSLLSGSPNVFTVNGAPAVPGSLAVDPAGRFVFAAFATCSAPASANCTPSTNSVAAIIRNPDGTLNSFAGGAAVTTGTNSPTSTTDTCFTPTSIAVDPSSKFLFVACPGDNASARIFGVQVYSISSISGQLVLAQTLNQNTAEEQPTAIAVDPSGKFLLAAKTFRNAVSVFSIDATTGALTEVSNSPFATGSGPNSLTFDASGQFVYVTNGGLLVPSTLPAPANDIAAFSFNASTGALTQISGSPFAAGTGPRSPATIVP